LTELLDDDELIVIEALETCTRILHKFTPEWIKATFIPNFTKIFDSLNSDI
jgi:hypothetical protein